jgi:hypothetical protein
MINERLYPDAWLKDKLEAIEAERHARRDELERVCKKVNVFKSSPEELIDRLLHDY